MSGFTSVSSTLTVGTIGQLAYGADSDMLARSYVADNTNGTIKPGYGVVYSATGAALAVAGTFLGASFDDGSLPIESTGFPATGAPNVPVLKRGVLWVATSEAVDPTDAVYVQITDNGGLKVLGSFRTDDDGGKAQLVTGASWYGVYSSGKAALQLNLPA